MPALLEPTKPVKFLSPKLSWLLVAIATCVSLHGCKRRENRTPNVSVDAAIGWSPPFGFQGYFVMGFEKSFLSPGTSCQALTETAWWLEEDEWNSFLMLEAWRLLREHARQSQSSRQQVLRADLIVVYSPEGQWGHMGGYRRKTKIVRVREIELADECEDGTSDGRLESKRFIARFNFSIERNKYESIELLESDRHEQNTQARQIGFIPLHNL